MRKKSLEELLIGRRPYKSRRKVDEVEAADFAQRMLRDLMEEGMHGGTHHFNKTKIPPSDWDGDHPEAGHQEAPGGMDWGNVDSGSLGYSDYGEGIYW